MGGSSQTSLPKFKLFNLLIETNGFFKVSKYKRKIQFDQIWGYQSGGFSLNGAAKFQTSF